MNSKINLNKTNKDRLKKLMRKDSSSMLLIDKLLDSSEINNKIQIDKKAPIDEEFLDVIHTIKQ
jgi:hypothetical protein